MTTSSRDSESEKLPIEEFFLSEDLPQLDISSGTPLWVPVEQDGPLYLALSLAGGQTATTPRLRFDKDSMLVCKLGAGSVSVLLQFEEGEREVLRIGAPSSVSLNLSEIQGRCARVVIHAHEDTTVLKWIIGRSDRIGLLNARTHHTRRLANEIAHFNSAYDLAFYGDRNVSETVGSYKPVEGGLSRTNDHVHTADEIAALPAAAVGTGERAYAYAHRLLAAAIDRPIVDFSARLRMLYRERPIRVLSLCSGTAAVERDIFERANVPLEVTAFDINEHLIGRAATTLAPFGKIFGILGDVNDIEPSLFATTYDVILCVSGLHHIVELEKVLSTVASLLEADGEFWAIGEQIGRNGNRLWPEARAAADVAFANLPPELRFNAHTKRIDEYIPEGDFSAMSFEGIRSSEIETLLLANFEPIEIYRRNCFLWRAVESAYFANYDLANEAHRYHLHRLIAAELAVYAQGGRPTELWAAYKRR